MGINPNHWPDNGDKYDRDSGPMPLDSGEMGLFEPSAHYDTHRWPDVTTVVERDPNRFEIINAVNPRTPID